MLDAREVAQQDHGGSWAGRRRVEVPEHRPLFGEILVIGVHLHGDHRVGAVPRKRRQLSRKKKGDRGRGDTCVSVGACSHAAPWDVEYTGKDYIRRE